MEEEYPHPYIRLRTDDMLLPRYEDLALKAAAKFFKSAFFEAADVRARDAQKLCYALLGQRLPAAKSVAHDYYLPLSLVGKP